MQKYKIETWSPTLYNTLSTLWLCFAFRNETEIDIYWILTSTAMGTQPDTNHYNCRPSKSFLLTNNVLIVAGARRKHNDRTFFSLFQKVKENRNINGGSVFFCTY